MSIFYGIIFLVCTVYLILNFKFDIQMFQQNSYRISRYWRWLKQNIGDSWWRLTDMACLMLLCSSLLNKPTCALVVAVVAIVKIVMILRRKYKKPLVFTNRVWRLYVLTALLGLAGFGTMLGLTITGIESAGGYNVALEVLFLTTILSFLPMLLAAVILMPIEKMIGRRYINDAKRILASMPELKIIGITGSYGKTSTKHYLHRMLSERFDTLMTPGSYNTPMGVVRTVREYLKPFNEVFICEMGAKQKGDIKEICDIVHPQKGIVTAVGPMHLESFKTIENIQATKFELVDELPGDGVAVINNDFEYCANRQVDNVKTLRYGITNTSGCDYIATDIRYTPQGTTFAIQGPNDFRLELTTRLLGECNVSDLLAAAVMALQMGVSPEQISYAVASLEQVEHRLSMKRTPGGVTIIDDAFNSNPAGSKMAVDVLSHFKEGKRIIVTPGMIELGERQDELNEALGRYIGENVDEAIIVGGYNRDSLAAGVESTGFDTQHLHLVASFDEAQKLLATMLKPGDTVLYENDLPDSFK